MWYGASTMSDTATTRLIKALTEAGIPYELDDNGAVKATPAVTTFLEAKEALHDPDNPVVKTKADLMGAAPEEDEEEDWYDFHEDPKVEETIETGDAEIGTSELEAPAARHRCIEVYTGPIKELAGEGALIKRDPTRPGEVAAQFNEKGYILNGRALGYGWHDFPSEHFSDSRPFLDKWRDIPSQMRGHMRRAKKIPRIHPKGTRFCTPKQMRRNTGGAFGGPGARRARVAALQDQHKRAYLVNVITDGGDENLSVAVRAYNERAARHAAYTKHRADFPDATILNVEVHEETAHKTERTH